MKTRYLIFIGIITFAFFAFEVIVYYSPTEQYPRLANSIQSAAVFVALIAAVIALSTADPKQKIPNIDIRTHIQSEKTKYSKKGLPQKLSQLYADFPDPFHSQQVHFNMRNISGFTLVKPTLTFRLPTNRQQPQKMLDETWQTHFNSNLYNSREELRQLEFNDTVILSNSNLPYWNSKEQFTIWIRMISDSIDTNPFEVVISVNCQNAQGFRRTVSIDRTIPPLEE